MRRPFTAAQKRASERNWKKAQLLAMLGPLSADPRIFKNPSTAFCLRAIREQIEHALLNEWPEVALSRVLYKANPSKDRARAECRAVLKEHGYTWEPKSIYEMRQAAAVLLKEVFE